MLLCLGYGSSLTIDSYEQLSIENSRINCTEEKKWKGMVTIILGSNYLVMNDSWCFFQAQAKKSEEDLKEVTHNVYFDVEIAGKPAGML